MNTFKVIPCEMNTDHAYTILDGQGNPVADVVKDDLKMAKLLASAPELLAALEALCEKVSRLSIVESERRWPGLYAAWGEATDLISKVKGE